MDFFQNMSKAVLKIEQKALADYLLIHPERERAFHECILSDHTQTATHAAAVMNILAERNEDWFIRQLPFLLDALDKEPVDALKRNVMRNLQWHLPGEDLQGRVLDISYRYLHSPNEAIAIRVFAMTVIYQLVLPYPELLNELFVVLEAHMPYGSAGFKSRAKLLMSKKLGNNVLRFTTND